MKPPKILIAAKMQAIKAHILDALKNCVDESSIIHPIIMIPLIALVKLIRGVCKAGVTFQTTRYPMIIEKIKINILVSKSILLSVIKLIPINKTKRGNPTYSASIRSVKSLRYIN